MLNGFILWYLIGVCALSNILTEAVLQTKPALLDMHICQTIFTIEAVHLVTNIKLLKGLLQ